MDDKTIFSPKRLLASFRYAFQGLFHAVQREKNMQIHMIAAIIACVLGLTLRISVMEWLFVALSIFGMWALELVNSAIERTVDLSTQEMNPLAKQAKDMAAGAVLVYAFFTLVVAGVIFIPKIWELF